MKNILRSCKTYIKSASNSSRIYIKKVFIYHKNHMKKVFINCAVHMKKILKGYKINNKNVSRIYKRDIKNILTNRATLIMMIGLILVPPLYAWFNIRAGWDPYLNTKGISVAIVNLDKGSELRNVKVNIGDNVVKSLKTNQSIGWTFVSESEAKQGIKYGKYYASLTMPKDFSKDLLSVATSDTPTKAKLIYTVNEKRNAIAPKLTKKGATALQSEITKNFIETSSGTILSFLTQIGVELENNKPQLKSLADMMISLDDKMPKIKKSMDNAYGQSVLLQKYMLNVKNNLPVMTNGIGDALTIAKTSNGYIEKSKDSLKAASPIIQKDLSTIKGISDTASSSLAELNDLRPSNNAVIKEALVKTRDKYGDAIQTIDNVLSLNRSLNNFLNSTTIDTLISNLSSARDDMTTQQINVNSMINTVDRGNQVVTSDINTAKKAADKFSNSISNIMDEFKTTIDPKIDNAMKNTKELSTNTVNMLQNIQNDMPLINSTLGQTNSQINSSIKSLNTVKNNFPKAQEYLHTNTEKLRGLTDDKKLNEIINMLKKDGAKESDFLSNPVAIKQNSIYPIPNYGSAMSPFYTTLAIWVGALLMHSLLSVEVKKFEDGAPLSTREKFLGRYFTFLTIAILQTLVTIVGNILLLKTYVVSPIILILFGIYVSIVFLTIIYSFVCILGNIGKALIVVVMVLQISASGGTFPVELLGSFFQFIHPMLPFTYAIGGMRETVAGIIPSVLISHVLTLSKYLVVCFILAFVLQERMNKINSIFIKEFNKSGLAE
ncbi:YhgE/Pip domain-containing protein [Clostridium estertheticum]|uniref:YhgE/Pip domain-containing protein n=1 Tax=Clostridium estertheticum TaxID=238834 RepID=UPI001C0B29D8|nr:YhgE/Pip domain-containing protein [Clostridium estertheticum]MBU3197687.1 YhgE/Pip domain-containing protein [Clostridium estertheticum]WAG65491.1 YhgE/Pip domain-containing protein [Clostridium estertheticum]